MGKRRTREQLDLLNGEVRSFEWFWGHDGSMPGLDAFERLDTQVQNAIIATLRHWADLPHGKRLSDSRVNEEHSDPRILAVKTGKHRFTVFHADDDTWIVHRYYEKRKAKLDRGGKNVIRTTVEAIRDYMERVNDGTYYDRT